MAMAVLLGGSVTANNLHYLIGWCGVAVIVLSIAITSIFNHRARARRCTCGGTCQDQGDDNLREEHPDHVPG